MIINLSEAEENKNYEVKYINGGFGLIKRLKDLGFINNEIIKVLKNDKSSPLLINVKGTNIVLGKGVARKILVEETKIIEEIESSKV